jgi:hypothetical protein
MYRSSQSSCATQTDTGIPFGLPGYAFILRPATRFFFAFAFPFMHIARAPGGLE